MSDGCHSTYSCLRIAWRVNARKPVGAPSSAGLIDFCIAHTRRPPDLIRHERGLCVLGARVQMLFLVRAATRHRDGVIASGASISGACERREGAGRHDRAEHPAAEQRGASTSHEIGPFPCVAALTRPRRASPGSGSKSIPSMQIRTSIHPTERVSTSPLGTTSVPANT